MGQGVTPEMFALFLKIATVYVSPLLKETGHGCKHNGYGSEDAASPMTRMRQGQRMGFKDAARPMTHSSSRKQLSNLATGWMSLPGHWSPALNTISCDEWCRTWPAHFNCHPLDPDGSVILTRTFYIDACIESRPRTAPVVSRTHTAAERLKSTLSQLAEIPSQFCITTLNLSGCAITCQDALILAGVLAQCAALSHLNLERNYIRGVGAGWLAPVLVQCTLSWLSLGSNEIGDEVRAGLREC